MTATTYIQLPQLSPYVTTPASTASAFLAGTVDGMIGLALDNQSIYYWSASGQNWSLVPTNVTTLTGTLAVAHGGTNSSTALSNNRFVVSSSGKIVEASAVTASSAVVSDANGLPTTGGATATEVSYLSGVTSAIQTQLTGKQATGSYITALTGDVTATGPGSVAATIANLAVTGAKIAAATIDLTAKVTGTLPVGNGGTGAATLASNAVLYGNSTGAVQALAVNATGTNKFLTQSSSAAPGWSALSSSDVPWATPGTLGSTTPSTAVVTTLTAQTSAHIGATGGATTGAVLDVDSTVGALVVPRMTTTQKNALTGVNGGIVYDTTLNQFYGYANGAWVSLQGWGN